MPTMAEGLFAGVMVLHGIAHIVGFVAPWRLLEMTEVPYKTTVLGGMIDLGDVGIRFVGILWLIVAIGFAATAMGLLTHEPWWKGLAFSCTALSMILTLTELPRTKAGLFVDVGLLVVLLADTRFGWFPTA